MYTIEKPQLLFRERGLIPGPKETAKNIWNKIKLLFTPRAQ